VTSPPRPDHDDDQHARPFAAFLREQAGGKTHDELSDALRDLVGRVQDTGKKGSLTLVVNVEPLKGDTDTLVIKDEIKLRLPEHDRKASLFFVASDGNLTRENPNQPQLPLHAAPNPADHANLKDAK
jgi:hypothetical protein